MNKKPWKTPELIVITRSRPEEFVLGTCKTAIVGSGPYSALHNCVANVNDVPATSCQGMAKS